MPDTTTRVKRKFVLSKVAVSDYILLANDAVTIYRFSTYEDGPSHGLEDMDRDQTFWGIWRWTGDSKFIDTRWDDGRWEFTEGFHDTRAEAIDSALRLDPSA